MKHSIFALALVGLSVGGMSGAMAQTDACQVTGRLTQAVGSVMVDRGNGFVPGVIGTQLRGGDKISVRGPGNAVVDFGSDRTLTVPASTTETIRPPGCGALQTTSTGVDPTVGIFGSLAAAVGVSAAVAAANDGTSGVIIFPVSP